MNAKIENIAAIGGTRTSRREEAFSKAYERTQKLDTLLEKKFEEARKKAKDADPDEKPHNPMDWD